jgi:cytochrome c553
MQGRRFLLGAAIALASAGSTAFEGDPAAAREHLSMCMGCHGIAGYRTAFPEVYPVPKLGGQHPEYLFRSLQAYRDGRRSHPTMQVIAQALTDQQMADLAAYYGRPEGSAQ